MSHTFEFYDQRAKEAATEAKNAKLANVRDPARRAAKTWRGLAQQAKEVARNRRRNEELKRSRQQAEAG